MEPNIVRKKDILPFAGIKVIKDGIQALKKSPEWPRGETSTPPYSDVSSSVFMEITPKKMCYEEYNRRRIHIPHHLSYERNVCYIDRGDVLANRSEEIITLLLEIGIGGKIKMIPERLVQQAIAQNDQDAIRELAQLYETHFVAKLILPKLITGLHEVFAEEHAVLNRVRRGATMKKDLEDALTRTTFLQNATKSAYLVKMAHCCFTDAQILENVQAVLRVYQDTSVFEPPAKRAPISITLKIGDSEGVVIFPNDDYFETLEKLGGDHAPQVNFREEHEKTRKLQAIRKAEQEKVRVLTAIDDKTPKKMKKRKTNGDEPQEQVEEPRKKMKKNKTNGEEAQEMVEEPRHKMKKNKTNGEASPNAQKEKKLKKKKSKITNAE